MKKVLQKILLGEGAIPCVTLPMYYLASERLSEDEKGGFILKDDASYDFSTYLNSFHVQKWLKYTNIDNVSLELDISGDFSVELLGYHADPGGMVHRYSLGRYSYKKNRDVISIAYPDNTLCSFFSFRIIAEKKCIIYGSSFCSDIKRPDQKQPSVSMVTVLKDDSEYIAHNISEVSRELRKDSSTADLFSWYIYDLREKEDNDRQIEGAEGVFVINGKGQSDDIIDLYTEHLKKHRVDYIIRAEADIIINADIFRRLACFLSVLKKEYSDRFIEGTMLDLSRPNIRVPDAGRTFLLKNDVWDDRELNLNDIKSVVRNDLDYCDISFDHIGWWLCVIPAGRIKKGLPFPGVSKSCDIQKDDVLTLNGFFFRKAYTNPEKFGSENIFRQEEYRAGISECKEDLQELLLGIGADADGNRDMFYRSIQVADERSTGSVVLKGGEVYYDFSTYFNSFSFWKWKEYTKLKKVYLELDVLGSFSIDLMGHYADNGGFLHKEWLGKYSFNALSRQKIIVEFPSDTRCEVFAFQIKTHDKDVVLFGGRYFTYLDDIEKREPFITLVTTTYKKEKYMEHNISILKKQLFSDDDYAHRFNWIIVDNGRTLDKSGIEDDNIRVIYNPNVGGSGGFTAGIIEANIQDKKATHVILMDDDVEFFTESFKRVYKLLSLLKDEYDKHFISGAMLEMEMKNIQHEDIGKTTPLGEHGPVKPKWDLNSWDSVIKNEIPVPYEDGNYAGWWFCCIPLSVARLDNLPLPLFIRGDDIEYSIRNKADFITMNGICIWHQGFGNKFSAAMEFYQVHRNDLVWRAMNPHVKGINIIKRIKDLFWEEIYKFNYKGAGLLLDAVEDFMKGPDHIAGLDGEKCMKEKKAKDNELFPLTPEIERLFDSDTLYEDVVLPKAKKMLYDYTYNGQMFFKSPGGKIAVIPYGWGYWPGRQFMADTIYAVDMFYKTYAVFKKNKKSFKALTDRYKAVFSDYYERGREVKKAYLRMADTFESVDFWNDYLEKMKG